MAYNYPPYGLAEGPDSYVDEFGATGNGETVFKCQGDKGRIIVNNGTNYYTITSSVMFSYLDDSKSLDALMTEYIEYLGGGASGIESASLGTIKAVYK